MYEISQKIFSVFVSGGHEPTKVSLTRLVNFQKAWLTVLCQKKNHSLLLFFPPSSYIINNEKDAISPKKRGTKVSPHYLLEVEGGKQVTVKLRLTNKELTSDPFRPEFDTVFDDRIREADDFYGALIPASLGEQQKMVSRQAYAGEQCQVKCQR